MIETLRDPAWQFVEVVVIVVLFVVPIFARRRRRAQRQRKALSLDTRDIRLLNDVKDEILMPLGKFRLLYKNEHNDEVEVKDAQILEIQVTNSGNVRITRNDYTRL